MSNKITDIYAREILDSRGQPTIEVTVEAGKIKASAKVPSGTSTGKYEARELRDNDPDRYAGKGVLKAAENVSAKIKPALLGMAIDRIAEIDQRLIELDGTENKSRLGANAVLGASLACARAGALANNLPLYQFIKKFYKFKFSGFTLPTPLSNLINGGQHADSNLDFQEFWVIPQNIKTFKEKTRAVSEIFHSLKGIILHKGYDTDVGAEGGYAPDVKETDEAWQMLKEAVGQAGYSLGEQIFLGLDAGASEFYENGKYKIKLENKNYAAEELSQLYQKWISQYPLLALEDPFSEDDWEAWKNFKSQISNLNKDILIIGDDLFATNISRLERGIEENAANAILIKPNQIGTLTETVNCVKLAKEHHFKIAVSHRSGETEDDFISDLAVAVGAEYVKIGAPSRSERVAKYNRLMEIEEQLIR